MDIFLLIIVLVLLIIVLARMGRSHNDASRINHNIELLHDEIKQLKNKIVTLTTTSTTPVPQKPQEDVVKPPVAAPPPPVTEEKKPDILPTEDAAPVYKHTPEYPIQASKSKPVVFVQPSAPKESWFAGWLARNPDIEKFIGENLINKIGIAILVLGIAFFVKYAIDQEWINEVGRVSIGLLCGAILLGLAHRLRSNYRSFSSVLVGGGITVFYFTIAFAFHQYHMFSQTVAFVIMVVITAFAVILAILYDRIELGIIATLGGFITPLLVSNGSGNYIVLFTYLAILNAGLIALVNYKQWRPINFIAFFFTVLIYGYWIVSRSGEKGFSYSGVFIFGTVFYLMFIVMNLIYHVSNKGKLKAFDFIILLSVNLAYYAAGFYLLKNWQLRDYTGLFTAALGLFNLLLSYALYKKQKVDKNFIFLLIGITLTFISLAAPVQLKGNYITLFWAAEMAVLFWLYQKSGIQLLKIASALITMLVIVSLAMDWIKVYDTGSVLPVVANKGFMTSLVVALAMFVTYWLMHKDSDTVYFNQLTNKETKVFYIAAGSAILFIAGYLEISTQFSLRYAGYALQDVYLPLYIYAFTIVLFIVLSYYKIKVNNTLRFLVAAILFLYYLGINLSVYDIEKNMLISKSNKAHFAAHWIAVILLLLIFNNLIQYVIKNREGFKKLANAFTWLVTIAVIVILSIEIQHLYVWFYASDANTIDKAETIFSKAGLSILWGVASFVIIWLGLKHHYKPLRIIALSLFGITILKLFAYDLSNISPGGKIAAFILLGALLLTVSFMYQRLKKIIIDDKPHESKTDEEVPSL